MADCPDCGKPFGTEAEFDRDPEPVVCGMGPAMAGSTYHYDGYALGLCRVATIARLRTQLAAARRGLAAWEALADWSTGATPGKLLPCGHGMENFLSIWADDTEGRGQDFTECAIDIAQKLQLIPEPK